MIWLYRIIADFSFRSCRSSNFEVPFMIQGLILAGGGSFRLHKNKMTLRLNGKPLICHTIASMRPFVDGLIVVTGYYHEDIWEAVHDTPGLIVVRNRFYEREMFSSVQYGARFLEETADYFVTPGDLPLIQASTYEALLKAEGDIRIPVYEGQRGHPVYIASRLLPSLLEEKRDSTLEQWIFKHAPTFVSVEDEGILLDVDTETDFEQLIRHYERMK